MTEPKSPREIAETIVGVLDPLDKYGSKGRDANIAYVEQALVSYAAERERLLAEADAVIADHWGDACTSDRRQQQCSEALARHEAREDQSRLRSRPATEGKGDD